MADKVELKSAPPAPDTGAEKLPEAQVQAPRGATTQITVDTTQEPKKDETKPERPAWLPEEFDTPEAFAEAWKKTKGAPEGEPAAGETPDAGEATQEQVADAVSKAGLDMAKLQDEFAKDGKLSDESLQSLEKAGITREVVDQYIEGQKARAEAATQRMAEAVGGQDNLAATLKWAETALTPEEIEAANKVLASGDEAQAKLVLTGLNTRRLQEVGKEPNLVGGKASPARGEVRGYASSQEWIADVNSAQYKNDPAFREKVMRRIAASNF